MILDLSFILCINGKPLTSVNDASDKLLAPQHAMYELGNVIPRLIWAMALAPDIGIPSMFTKVDLKDGYWQMVINTSDAWNFAYVLSPVNTGDDVKIVIPDCLQMGWGESPLSSVPPPKQPGTYLTTISRVMSPYPSTQWRT